MLFSMHEIVVILTGQVVTDWTEQLEKIDKIYYLVTYFVKFE